MTMSVDFPEEINLQLTGIKNINAFIVEAVKKALEKQFITENNQELSTKESMKQTERELFALMASIPRSVSLVDDLIQERRLEAKKEREENA